MIILIMGVAGAGKTTVGLALAEHLHWRFADADNYHSPANIARMHAGIALTDEDRAPWLQSLRTGILGWLANRDNVVLACSALKNSYRDILMVSSEVKLVYLRADEALIASRLAKRADPYMSPTLASSQFEALEEPPEALTIDAAQATGQIVANILSAFAL